MFIALVHAIVLARVNVNAHAPALVRALVRVTGVLVGDDKCWFSIPLGKGGKLWIF